ncbi:FKBP-type peptidyl-prolyl cis-trans isomerase [Endozoicomonas sp. 8E]|uniref:FKBP-type peptidyl-prolyl cis-trans isomerase n=1 Tax=Endozoicomonas sp. 8E TaxID=3035692 RepID=UPI00293906DB|nr:FKBP-type peptidyl-prolyl cis-trans isomerase [Endozoicomonas sp. 8E]WOG27265.1 FKBP-type peptidyl-prolyl cis-trans isomerase [Endozoicomonas sp. 8E]
MSTAILIIFIAIILFWGKRRFDQKKQLAQEALVQGQAFLEKNHNEEGVITTESGLQYKILEKSEHSDHPSATSKVKVHYHGTLVNGQVFDSSVDRGQPISFGLNQVIPGWTEGLQRMSVGDKFRLFIPANLAYGSGGAGKIPGNSALIFDVELLGIE